MATGHYTFVPEKGMVRVTGDLNVRKGLPTTAVDIAVVLHSGTQKPYIGYVTDGESVAGNAKWYLTSEGDFFWSGNVDAKNTPPTPKILAKPLDELACTQKFGERPEYYVLHGSPKGHNGMDFRTRKVGNLTDWKRPVYAVLEGTVTEATENQWNGKFVRIAHDNGYESVYVHLSALEVTKGQKVLASARIAVSGNTGGATEAPHLHFGYRPQNFDKNNGYMGYIDPAPYFKDAIQYL